MSVDDDPLAGGAGAGAANGVMVRAPTRELSPGDAYTEAVRKLLPVEVTGAFIALNSLIPQQESLGYVVVGAIVALSIVCALYLRLRQGVANHWQVAVTSAVAFPAWAAAVGSSRCSFLSENTYVMPGVLIIVSLLLPLLPLVKSGGGK